MLITRREVIAGGAASLLIPAEADALIGPRRIAALALTKGVGGVPGYPNFPKFTLARFRQVSDVLGGGSISGLSDQAGKSDPYYGGATGLQYDFNAPIGSPPVIRPAVTVPAVDVTGAGTIRFRHRPISNLGTNWANVSSVEVRLYSSGSPSSPPASYHKATVDWPAARLSLSDIWTWVGVPVSWFSATGSGADLSAITFASVVPGRSSATIPSLGIGDIEYVPNPLARCVVIPRIDDAPATFWSWFIPNILDPLGVKGMVNGGASLSPQGWGGSGAATRAQAFAAHNEGHQIMGQAGTTEGVPADLAASIANYQAMVADGAANGWRNDLVDGSNHSSANTGNKNVWSGMATVKTRTVQRADFGDAAFPQWAAPEVFPFMNPYNIRALNVAAPGGPGGTSVADAVEYLLNYHILHRAVLIVMGHGSDFNSGGNGRAAWARIMDRKLANPTEFDIKTMDQLLSPHLAAYGADPNWPHVLIN